MGLEGTLPPVVAILTANTREFTAKMGEAGAQMKALQVEGGSSLRSLASLGKGALLGLGTAAVAVSVVSVKMASDFDSAMEQIHTQAGASQAEVDKMKGSVLSLAGKTATAPLELADALYHVESNGFRGAQALSILQLAAEGAKIGHANLTDTTNALSAAINSGIPGVHNYSQAMGALNAIVGSGDMQMQDLNDAMGTGVTVIAKQFGLSLNDVGSALATFGDNNIRGAKAGTELRMAIMDLAKQSAAGQKELAKFGIKAGELGADMRKGGLGLALTDLKDKLTKAGVTGSKVGEVLTDAFTKKASAPLAILMDQLGRFDSKQKLIAQGAGQFGADWKSTTEQFQFKVQRLEEQIKALAIRLGNFLIPAIEKVVHVVVEVVGWFEKHRTVAMALGIAIGAVLVPALVAFAAALALDAIEMLVAMAPLIAIELAVAALAVGIYELVTHWKTVWAAIKHTADDAWAFFKKWWPQIFAVFTGGLTLLIAYLITHWDRIWADIRRVWNTIMGFFKQWWPLLVGVFTGPIGLILGLFGRFHAAILGAVQRVWHDVAGFFSRMWSDATGWVKRLVGDVVGMFERLPFQIMSAVGSLLGDMVAFGEKIVGAIIQGIGNMGSGIFNAIKSHIPGGGVIGSALGAVGLAEGGIVTKPTLAIVGEAGYPEAVIPLKHGVSALGFDASVGDLGLLGAAGQPAAPAGSGAGGTVTVSPQQINLQMDGQTFAKFVVTYGRPALLRRQRLGTLGFA